MKVKLFLSLLLISVVSFLSFSCSDDGEEKQSPYIKVSSPIFQLGYEGGEQTVKIDANYEFTATVPARDSWCKVKVSDGAITITVEENYTLETRTTKVKLESTVDDETITSYVNIMQAPAPAMQLSLSEESMDVEPDAASYVVKVLSSKPDWTVSYRNGEAKDWCIFTKNEVDGEINIAVTENVGDTMRTATAYVKVGVDENYKEVPLVISQFGAKTVLNITPMSTDVPFDGGHYELTVQTNRDTFDLMSIVNNTVANVVLKASEKKIIVDIYENFDFANGRNVSFDIVAGKFPDQITRTVTFQQAKATASTISTEKTSYLIDATASTLDIPVTCNRKGWVVSTNPDASAWFSVTKSADESKVTLSLQDNAAAATRSFEVILTAGSSSNIAVQKFQVTQKPGGGGDFISLSETKVTFEPTAGTKSISVLASQDTWTVTVPSTATWCTASNDNGSLKINVTASDGSRNCKLTLALGSVTAEVFVSQSAIYAVGDYYTLNGTKIGIVYEISDGGKHGKVISLKQSDPMYFLDLSTSSDDNTTFPCLGTDQNDGTVNASLVKATANWKDIYIAYAWVDDLDVADGNPGWYLPAIKEVTAYRNYIGTSSPAEQAAMNAKFEDVGGDPIYYGWYSGPGVFLSSTEKASSWGGEVMAQYAEYDFEYGLQRYSLEPVYDDEWGDYTQYVGSVRAVLKY